MGHHLPHDARHTCATLMDLTSEDEKPIVVPHRKKILGHSCNDITLDLYTHNIINSLVDDINKIHQHIGQLSDVENLRKIEEEREKLRKRHLNK